MVFLVVDESLENVSEYIHREYMFQTQKVLSQSIMNGWKNVRNRFPVEKFIGDIREFTKDKMVIEFSDKESDNTLWHSTRYMDIKKVQEAYLEIQKKINVKKLPINSLNHYIDIALRRAYIQDFYKKNIAPKISKAAMELNDKKNAINSFHIKGSGWGYIAAYRHKVVMEFEDRPCFWIKLIHSDSAVDLVEQNLTKNKDNRIFLGKPDESIRYIDVFTSDGDTAHLFEIITPDDTKVFNVNLEQLLSGLKELNLFYAIQDWAKVDKEEDRLIIR